MIAGSTAALNPRHLEKQMKCKFPAGRPVLFCFFESTIHSPQSYYLTRPRLSQALLKVITTRKIVIFISIDISSLKHNLEFGCISYAF